LSLVRSASRWCAVLIDSQRGSSRGSSGVWSSAALPMCSLHWVWSDRTGALQAPPARSRLSQF